MVLVIKSSVFLKQLQVQMWNNLKTAWKLMKFICRYSIYAPLVTLQTHAKYLIMQYGIYILFMLQIQLYVF
jgi:hypothetical protein